MEIEKLKFRKLKAEEIDVRIGTAKDLNKGISLLLYKDARCDMNILDETVGTMNWDRLHKELNGNIYCGVEIRHNNKCSIKWDVGSKSNTEAVKGESSDSFKRACFNWGIGRELYTSPFIWLNAGLYKTKFDKFKVNEIGYDKDGKINKLSIYSLTLKKVVFEMGKFIKSETPPSKAINTKADLIDRAKKVGVNLDSLAKHLNYLKVEDLDESEIEWAIDEKVKKNQINNKSFGDK